MSAPLAQIHVRRGGPADSTRYDTFEVPWEEGMSVLDALIWIRQHVDSSVSMRYSCLNANACKECSAVVDGKVTFLCTARLTETPVTVECTSSAKVGPFGPQVKRQFEPMLIGLV